MGVDGAERADAGLGTRIWSSSGGRELPACVLIGILYQKMIQVSFVYTDSSKNKEPHTYR